MAPTEVCLLCEEGYLIVEKSLAEYKVVERHVNIKAERHSHVCNNCGVDILDSEDMKFNAASYKDALAAL